MEIVVTGRHTQIKQRFRDVVESKMNRVTAIAPDAQRVQIVLSHEGNPRQADTAKRVEITVIAGRTVVRAEASSADEFSALDMALDKLTLRLRRTRDRRKDHRRGYSDPVPVDLGVVEPTPEVEETAEEEVEEPNNSPADAVAADDAIAAGLASNNTGDHLKIVDVPDTTWSYGIAVKSGQDELVGQIDAALRAMVKDGSWQKAAADMGKSIGYTPDASMNPPKATAKAPSSGASAASEK